MQVVRQASCEEIFPYIAYLPERISDHPALLIQLHGAGERGVGEADLDKVLIHGFSNVVNDENLRDCVLVMPQCSPDSFWVAKIESIKEFMDIMLDKFSIDPDRVYLCGMSMGGFGTWYTAMAYPGIFAAIVPCCGGGMAWNARVLTMPIWAFHGLKDTVVLPKHSMEMIDALKDWNTRLKYTFFENVGHESWRVAFSEETLRWILAQRRMKNQSVLSYAESPV